MESSLRSSPSKNFYGHTKVKFTQSSLERAKRRTKSRKCVNVSNTLKRPPPPKPMTRQPFHSGLKFRGGDTSATRTFETTLTHSEPEQVNHRVRDLYKEQIPVLQQNFSIGNLVDKYELPMTSSRKNSTSELVIPKDIESIEHPDPEKSKDRLLKEIAIMENLPPMLNNEKQVKKAEEKLVKHSPDWVILSGQPQKDKALGKRLKKLRKGSILVRNRQQQSANSSSSDEEYSVDINKNRIPQCKWIFFKNTILLNF